MTNVIKCKKCGCSCIQCNLRTHDVHLLVEVENLKQRLLERDTHIAAMETNLLDEVNKFPNGEIAAFQEEVFTWREKYDRLYDAHRRIQRVNQGLEDKLLRLVDIGETDKNALTKDVAVLSHKLAEANYTIKKLSNDNERYKNDVAVAVQFLQCKQGNFVAQKFDSLPNEVQAKVSSYVGTKKKPEERKSPDVKSIKVPIPTFPPTAMVYSVSKSEDEEESEEPPVNIVSAAIMAKVLEEREKERNTKHCDTCTCGMRNLKIIYDTKFQNTSTQTGDSKLSLCLRCNSDLLASSNGMKLTACDDNNSTSISPTNCDDINEDGCENGSCTESHIQTNGKLNGSSPPQMHHHLCTHNNSISSEEKKDMEKNSKVKGPRYCSVRVQTGSKNILLDNISSNVSPVLYTHPVGRKLKNDRLNSQLHSSIQSGNSESKQNKSNVGRNSQTNTVSSEERSSVNVTGESIVQNQQRVAEWIQSNQHNLDDPCSSDNSRSDSLKKIDYDSHIDRVKYAQMEKNVKQFLFENQSEFLKTVAIGKQNYQNLRENAEKNNINDSHAETQI